MPPHNPHHNSSSETDLNKFNFLSCSLQERKSYKTVGYSVFISRIDCLFSLCYDCMVLLENEAFAISNMYRRQI